MNIPLILKVGRNCTSLEIGKKYATTMNGTMFGTSSFKKRQCLD